MGAKENKFTLSIIGVKDDENKIKFELIAEGNKLNIIEAIIMLLRDKEENEIQGIFEAVKEYV